MALITCKDCQKEFSTEAKQCPHCGAKKPKGIVICKKCEKPFSRTEKKCPHCGARKPLSTGLKIVLILVSFGALGNMLPDNVPSPAPQVKTEPPHIAASTKPSEVKTTGENLSWDCTLSSEWNCNPSPLEECAAPSGHSATPSHNPFKISLIDSPAMNTYLVTVEAGASSAVYSPLAEDPEKEQAKLNDPLSGGFYPTATISKDRIAVVSRPTASDGNYFVVVLLRQDLTLVLAKANKEGQFVWASRGTCSPDK